MPTLRVSLAVSVAYGTQSDTVMPYRGHTFKYDYG